MIALALGGRTISEWQDVMSVDEFLDWVAYYQIQPYGPVRGDLNAAFICTVMANQHVEKGKRKFQPNDFMPEFKPAQSGGRMTPDEMLAAYRAMKGRHG